MIIDRFMNRLRKIPEHYDLLKSLPQKIIELEKRIKALEDEKRTQGFTICPSCKKPEFKLISSTPTSNFLDRMVERHNHKYECQSCGYSRVYPHELKG